MEKTITDKLAELGPQLPEGYQIVNGENLNILIAQKKDLETVFAKLKPLFTTFSGSGQTDIMSALPTLLPVITGMQDDTELSEALNRILERL